ncbi:Hypothetical predicted protein [Podarcis lilfordi]|uniref:Uncharacterized protein n=1 Tax=Podarcis lilfordi TaxID=74358 RepID=A0AA35L541_9SAUR|nr:Hypothetical predicted protein [Podarcis lilfordi]
MEGSFTVRESGEGASPSGLPTCSQQGGQPVPTDLDAQEEVPPPRPAGAPGVPSPCKPPSLPAPGQVDLKDLSRPAPPFSDAAAVGPRWAGAQRSRGIHFWKGKSKQGAGAVEQPLFGQAPPGLPGQGEADARRRFERGAQLRRFERGAQLGGGAQDARSVGGAQERGDLGGKAAPQKGPGTPSAPAQPFSASGMGVGGFVSGAGCGPSWARGAQGERQTTGPRGEEGCPPKQPPGKTKREGPPPALRPSPTSPDPRTWRGLRRGRRRLGHTRCSFARRLRGAAERGGEAPPPSPYMRRSHGRAAPPLGSGALLWHVGMEAASDSQPEAPRGDGTPPPKKKKKPGTFPAQLLRRADLHPTQGSLDLRAMCSTVLGELLLARRTAGEGAMEDGAWPPTLGVAN